LLKFSRFIPAWAGNGPEHLTLILATSVHPRVGGERIRPDELPVRSTGSSPRGRGTANLGGRCCIQVRFIPAWAGNGASCNA